MRSRILDQAALFIGPGDHWLTFVPDVAAICRFADTLENNLHRFPVRAIENRCAAQRFQFDPNEPVGTDCTSKPVDPFFFTRFAGNFSNTLVNLDAALRPVPELAESWSISDDGLRLTLKLRQGVKFHSGRTFTAEDAKWNLEYAQDPRSMVQAGAELAGIRITATDAHTLNLQLPEPLPHIFMLLLNTVGVDPESNLAQTAGGTGPFKLDTLKPGDEMRLVRNDRLAFIAVFPSSNWCGLPPDVAYWSAPHIKANIPTATETFRISGRQIAEQCIDGSVHLMPRVQRRFR